MKVGGRGVDLFVGRFSFGIQVRRVYLAAYGRGRYERFVCGNVEGVSTWRGQEWEKKEDNCRTMADPKFRGFTREVGQESGWEIPSISSGVGMRTE